MAIVAYYSMTGHSKKIAEAIGSALNLPVQLITEPIPPTDILFIVGGIYSGKSSPQMLEAIEKLDANTIEQAAVLTSSAGATDELHMVRAALQAKNIPVYPKEFVTRGGFLVFWWSHPNKSDIEDAVQFAREALASISH